MSYDLNIVTSQKVSLKHLRDFFSSHADFRLDGLLYDDGGNIVVRRHTEPENAASFIIDGPFQVELEDLEEEVRLVVPEPRWLLQITIPAATTDNDREMAHELACFLADVCQGAVDDPQVGGVTWPIQLPKPASATIEEQRIRLVGLEWFLPAIAESHNTAKALLDVIRRVCPAARPTRFGAFEPLQSRLEPGIDQPFIAMWNDACHIPWGDSFFWKAASPCYGGSVFFPDQRDEYKPERVSRAVRLSMDFDGRKLHEDTQWCEAVVSLFIEIAQTLNAFYALGHVQRGAIAQRGSIWFDNHTEASPILAGKWWMGLSPTPTWLGWFGGWYAHALEPVLAKVATHQGGQGIFLRLGPEPMDREQLSGIFPRLPADLLVEQVGPEYQPAQQLPASIG